MNKQKRSYRLNDLHILCTVLLNGDALPLRDTKAFVMTVFSHFPVSSKCAEALNEIIDFLSMEGSPPQPCAYKMTLGVAVPGRDVKC